MPVTREERKQAARQAAESEYAARLAAAASARLMRGLYVQVLGAARTGKPVKPAVHAAFADMRPLLVQAMLWARLKSATRIVRVAPTPAALSLAYDPFSPTFVKGLDFMARRMNLTTEQMLEMESQASAHVVEVLADVEAEASATLQRTVFDNFKQGLHNRDSIKALRESFDSLGISERNSFQLEAISRTQTQLAYAAGQGDALADPDIEEVLWGYKLCTVGDNRVRPTHRALDGTTLPKGDPFWNENLTPLGWGCRCQAIPIFEKREIVRPPKTVKIDGVTYRVGADEGFRFRPSKLLPPVKRAGAR